LLFLSEVDSFKGEISALISAFLWAISSTIYTALGQKIPPIVLNLSKGTIAIVYILITLFFLNETIPTISIFPLSFLLLSGAIGIGFGDNAYFSALNYLGARKTLLIQTIAPAIAALLALVFLKEQIELTSWCGILLTIGGIAWVITERSSDANEIPKNQVKGIIWAVIAAISQAVGAIFSRIALTNSDLSTLWSALFRLFAGVIFCITILIWQKQLLSAKPLAKISPKFIVTIVITAFGSTYLGIWLQQISLKFISTGIAQTLSATSPIFVIPLTIYLGEKIGYRSICGVFLALIGIALLFVN
jgi:drug/metabolite transporter (DMT)-like permease